MALFVSLWARALLLGRIKMNQLIVKIRERGKADNKFRKVLSDVAVFTLPANLSDAVEYSPSTLLLPCQA